MQPKSNIVHLPVYQPGKPIEDVKREFGLTDVVKLASNENPYGCSPKAKEAVINELARTNLYPDGASTELTLAVARHLGVETSQIVFGAGSDEVILMITRAFLVPGDETVMATSQHTFPQYKHNAEVEGAVCVEVPLKDGVYDLPAMLAKVTPRTKIVWICNPNNPTGTIVTHQEIKRFMEQISPEVLVVLDEAYCEYTTSSEYHDGLALLKEYPNVLLLRTFSKIYGLASLRIGYAVGRPDIIRYINQVREPFNTTRFAQAAAAAALADQSFVDFCRSENVKGIAYLQEQFDRLGFSYLPAHGNFILVDVQRSGTEVFDALQRKGVIVRAGHFPTCIRVTVGSPEENIRFIETLEEVLKETAVQA